MIFMREELIILNGKSCEHRLLCIYLPGKISGQELNVSKCLTNERMSSCHYLIVKE